MLAPVTPPMTPRELVYLILGEEHVDHCVANINDESRPLVVECSCGDTFALSTELAKALSTTLKMMNEAVESSPRLRSLWAV